MSGISLDDLVAQAGEIRRTRSIRKLAATLTSVATAELIFMAFAFGAARGPVPLRPVELLLGGLAALFLGVAAAILGARSRLESKAKFAGQVRIAGKKGRVAVFDDHLTIGSEIVVRQGLERAEREGDVLVLRYEDAAGKGPVLRELHGDQAVLDRICAELAPS